MPVEISSHSDDAKHHRAEAARVGYDAFYLLGKMTGVMSHADRIGASKTVASKIHEFAEHLEAAAKASLLHELCVRAEALPDTAVKHHLLELLRRS